MPNIIQHKLIYIKEKLGLTVPELSGLIGVNKYSIYRWLKEGPMVQEKNLEKIHRLYMESIEKDLN